MKQLTQETLGVLSGGTTAVRVAAPADEIARGSVRKIKVYELGPPGIAVINVFQLPSERAQRVAAGSVPEVMLCVGFGEPRAPCGSF